MTSSPLTLQLAQALGLYLIVMGLGAFASPQRWKSIIDEMERSPALVMIAGVLAFAIGAALALSHTILTDPAAIAVTVIGWAALIKGALLIAVPRPLLRIGRASLRLIRFWSIAMILIGLALGIAGLTGTTGSASSPILV
jgi:uncharacterized protein YjeT (DUF2065 family)